MTVRVCSILRGGAELPLCSLQIEVIFVNSGKEESIYGREYPRQLLLEEGNAPSRYSKKANSQGVVRRTTVARPLRPKIK